MNSQHTFHIPVMGTSFTIDSPVKVARYGISSVVSLVDDALIEDMRQFYCLQYNEPFTPIKKFDEDWRARRITEYLNLLDRIVKKQFEALRQSAFEAGSEITKYFELLPQDAPLKKLYNTMLTMTDPAKRKAIEDDLRQKIAPGWINVNIMTKLDRPNTDINLDPLPETHSDALAALRGYAQSTLHSAIVLSAGLNRRLYTYMEDFEDFYADAAGQIKKQIILKVSDYRSAITQGKFFAKKGLWVSEYRIESGLNCGGHAFAGNGNLMGPILEDFKTKKQELMEQLSAICREALESKKKTVPAMFDIFRVTAQGGIGTFAEDQFLKRFFHVDSTGWGSPLLLVPEATSVDDDTLNKLAAAKEDDLCLSDISPLGVPFHTLKSSLSELQKKTLINAGRPGSPCPLGHLVSNTEFTEQAICTASRQYQAMKINALKKENLAEDQYKERLAKVTAKACICSDLGASAYMTRKVVNPFNRIYPAICPGPNIAYFHKVVSLNEMLDHIYGRSNTIMLRQDRPHMFIKELLINIEYYEKLIKESGAMPDSKRLALLAEYEENIAIGIAYYRTIASLMTEETEDSRARFLSGVDDCERRLASLKK